MRAWNRLVAWAKRDTSKISTPAPASSVHFVLCECTKLYR